MNGGLASLPSKTLHLFSLITPILLGKFSILANLQSATTEKLTQYTEK